MISQFKITYSQVWAKIYLFAAVFSVVWHYFTPSELTDTGEYLRTALSWISLQEISDTPLSEIRRSPLYPLLSYLEFPITGSPGLFSLRLIQFIASLFIPVIINQVLKLLEIEAKFKWVMIILISYPLQFYYTALELPDILAQLLLLILFKQLILKKNTGITVALLIGLKPIFFYLLVLPVLQIFLKHERNWIKILFPFLFFGGCLLFNKQKHQLISYTSMGTTNAYYYNRKMLLTLVKPDKLDSIYSQESISLSGFSKNNFKLDSFMKSKTFQTIMDFPLQYAFIHFKGSIQALLDPGRYDAMVFWNWTKTSGFLGVNDGNPKSRRPLFEWIYIIGFALLGLWKFLWLVFAIIKNLKFQSYANSINLIIFCLFIYLFLLGPVGAARYLLPWYSVIAILLIQYKSLKSNSR